MKDNSSKNENLLLTQKVSEQIKDEGDLKDISESSKCEFDLNEFLNKDPSVYELISLQSQLSFNDPKEELKMNQIIWNKLFDEMIKDKRPEYSLIEYLLSVAKKYEIKGNKLEEVNKLSSEYHKVLNKLNKCFDIDSFKTINEEIENGNIDLIDIQVQRCLKIQQNSFKNTQSKNKYLGKKRDPDDPFYSSSDEEIIKPKSLSKKPSTKEKKHKKLIKKKKSFSSDISDDSLSLEGIDTLPKERSKRNVKRKVDPDYVYGKDFVDDFENKIAVRKNKSV